MSLPVVLPGSCCPAGGAPPLPEPSLRGRARGLSASSRLAGGGGSRLLLPGRPLLSLGLLQLLLGGSMVALSFGALSLSSSAPIRNSCPFWAGSSVILSGIVGLTTWRKPMLLLDESRTSVENREEPPEVPDPDDFVAPAPPPSYFSTFYSYTPRLACRMVGNSGIPLPHIYGARIKGVEVFCPLDPPPPYEAVAVAPPTGTAQEIELTLDPSRTSRTPVEDAQVVPGSAGAVPQVRQPAVAPTRSRGRMCRSHSDPVLIDLAAKVWNSSGLALAPPAALQTTDSSTQTSQPTLALQAQAQAQAQVTLRRGRNGKRTHPRARPTSMVDYQSYQHTQHLVRKILEQPAAQGLAPEVQELVDSIRNVLQSDQEHMDEAVRCASYIEQVFSESDLASGRPRPEPQSGAGSQTFPRPPCRRAGLLHLPSCGDLSSYTCAALQPPDRPGPRPGSRTGPRAAARLEHPERAHSLIGVFRETVL
ncbi:protein FAM189A2 isoform X2 [Salarias fasciatus]|uniref:Family with sequence similarity 189 member A2 n=1 Tax=Salarias fasciatus TaxID=181472 RepID=A0A672GCH5_SALFA|nr:protein FAM189A2 isoform X2 [Salarias fasciatus]